MKILLTFIISLSVSSSIAQNFSIVTDRDSLVTSIQAFGSNELITPDGYVKLSSVKVVYSHSLINEFYHQKFKDIDVMLKPLDGLENNGYLFYEWHVSRLSVYYKTVVDIENTPPRLKFDFYGKLMRADLETIGDTTIIKNITFLGNFNPTERSSYVAEGLASRIYKLNGKVRGMWENDMKQKLTIRLQTELDILK